MAQTCWECPIRDGELVCDPTALRCPNDGIEHVPAAVDQRWLIHPSTGSGK